jgi:hypothetical protein
MPRPFEACNYIDINGIDYMYLTDDSPDLAYQSSEISFVAQPIADKITNKRHNVITVPLMMTDEWEIIKENPALIPKLRSNKKIHTFNFVGQCNYMGRHIFKSLNLSNYDFEETQTVYNLKKPEKKQKLIHFLNRISESKFVFCPRGIGSSSFRAYQSMMSGSIPIITGMNDYPFEDEVDWDEISIRGSLENIKLLIDTALNMQDFEYNKMKKKCTWFWDNYCKHDMLYNFLAQKVNEQ